MVHRVGVGYDGTTVNCRERPRHPQACPDANGAALDPYPKKELAIMADFVRYEKRDRVVYVTLNRPEVMNALHPPLNAGSDLKVRVAAV